MKIIIIISFNILTSYDLMSSLKDNQDKVMHSHARQYLLALMSSRAMSNFHVIKLGKRVFEAAR